MKILQALTLATTAAGAAAVGHAQELSYSNPFPSNHSVQQSGIDPFAEALEESTGGDLTLTVHSGGVMAKGPATLDAIQNSIVDAGLVVSAWATDQLPATEAYSQLSMAVTDPRVAAGAANEFYLLNCPECEQENQQHNARPLAFYASAPYHFICLEPLDSLEELAGKRVRATSGTLVNWVQSFGARVVAVPTEEIYQSMQRGQVDCTVGPLAYLQTLKLSEVAEWVHGLAFQPYYGATALTLNESSWSGLDDTQKQAIKDNLAALVRNVTEGYIRDTNEALAEAKDAGIEYAAATDAEEKRLEDYTDTEYERVLAVARERQVGGDDPKARLDELVALMEKWEKLVAEMDDGDFDAYEQALQDEIFSKL